MIGLFNIVNENIYGRRLAYNISNFLKFVEVHYYTALLYKGKDRNYIFSRIIYEKSHMKINNVLIRFKSILCSYYLLKASYIQKSTLQVLIAFLS